METTKLKYLCFTFEGIGMSIFKKLIEEGNDVLVCQIQDCIELMDEEHAKQEIADRKKETAKETAKRNEKDKRRLAMYDGVFKKYTVEETLKFISGITNKDEYFCFFDFNNLWKLSEKVSSMGFKNGIFPTKWDYKMENDRDMAKDFVKQFYPRLKVAEVREFKKVDDAKLFLEESQDVWVLKANSDSEAAKTVVPDTDDIERAKQLIINHFDEAQAEYESEGFILEQKIRKVKEVTPEIIFYNGEPVCTTIDIENKPVGAGNCSTQTGCMQNLIGKTELSDSINTIAFPKKVYELAKERKGLFIWDASLLYSPEDNEYYFGEFCSQRFGWDSIFSEIAMSGGASRFFEGIVYGKDPFIYNFGVSVRGLNLNRDKKYGGYRGDIVMSYEDNGDTWVYELKKDGDILTNTGDCWDLVVFTGAEDTVEKAVDIAYEALEGFTFEELYYRPKFDFMSYEYPTSIPNRFKIFNHDLFDLPDINSSEVDDLKCLLQEKDDQLKEIKWNLKDIMFEKENEED